MAMPPYPLTTQRLVLVPATLAHVEAELVSKQEINQLLCMELPASWPPGEYDKDALEFFRDRLTERPDSVGWYHWYIVMEAQNLPIGVAGFLGPPRKRHVEIGFSILPEYTSQGYATEAVNAFVDRAYATNAVDVVVAHTDATNLAAVKVLTKAGFQPTNGTNADGQPTFVRVKPPLPPLKTYIT